MSGRPLKYKTDEERKRAKNEQTKKCIEKNKEKYNLKNLIRYYEKKILQNKDLTESMKKRDELINKLNLIKK